MRIIFLLFLLACFQTQAEIYKDFAPFTTVAQMKAKYPNAKFEIVKAAWVKEKDKFIKITGDGLPGTIYVATSKSSDAVITQRIERYKALIAENPDQDNSAYNAGIEFNEKYLSLPDDERYSIDWLRWVPDVAIPLERLKAKFGEPNKYDYGESDFQPFAEWSARDLHVNLSDDKKLVYSIEYHFTDEEYDIALGVKDAPSMPADAFKPVQKKSKLKTKSK
ncbi:hypothetical protein [Methylophilus sp. UBA6697]|jgi:hypothetical protein|uniref:hypothetical protein n=1 Tax=Methylophilus sp. UBA6697 TaxID=1946902 RepID=UPI000EEB5B85|nr:hypothetical protein [Methylophilus sp. UBA6697]HCU84866.1 hypothetical protein [Methylophilus sp.]